MTIKTQAAQDCLAQLAQIETQIAECLAARKTIRTQASHRTNEQSLHGLYMLQYDVRQDLAHRAA